MNRLLAVAFAAALLGATAVAAFAAPGTMMPSQEFVDAPMPGSPNNATWSDLPGGLAARPYVKSLAVVNGSQRTTVFSGGVDAAKSVRTGDVTAVVSPTNLCRAGQTPAPGQCYATPNRVGISFGYKTDQGLGLDFSSPSVPLNQTVSASTVLDVVIGLNTLGKTLRWSWINGQLVNWKTSGLGTDAAEIHLRVRPSQTPNIDWSTRGPVGCTATPIRDCDIAQADGTYLGSQMVLSLDDTLDASLTGAAFATQGAIAGYLVPGGSAAAPTLDMQIASSHLAADGSPQRGILQAFLPAGALTTLYGVVPADAASFFTATRRGDPGTQDAPTFAARSESDDDSAGLMITVGGITFSAPTYRVTRKAATLRARTSARGKTVSVSSASKVAGCRAKACTATVYRIAKGLTAKATKVAGGRSDARGAVTVKVPRGKLPKGATYVLSVRKAGKAVASTRGRAA
ncbi:MAG TPA: hypothetical protein VFB41_11635 [Solirubrobacteraceae bacterium]|nr:hypothetical protein [Solirubrobacteraceae bacterium]